MTNLSIPPSFKSQVVKNNSPVSFKAKDELELYNNSSSFYTNKDSYDPEKQVERKEFEAEKNIEAKKVRMINNLILNACEDNNLTEKKKKELDNLLTEVLQDSKLRPELRETIKNMVFKTIEKYPQLTEEKKIAFKNNVENIQKIKKDNIVSNGAFIAVGSFLFFASPEPLTKWLGYGLYIGGLSGLTSNAMFIREKADLKLRKL